MNWEALGAIGEFFGALAVVVSLAYLAAQVVQNTRAIRATATDSAVKGLRDWIRPLIQDAELSRIFRLGIEDWERLDEDGKARFFHMMLGFMKTLENLHFQYNKGSLDSDLWSGWEYLMTGYIQSPGGQAYWKHRSHAFSRRFRKYVDSLPENTDFTRAAQLTGEVGRLELPQEYEGILPTPVAE